MFFYCFVIYHYIVLFWHRILAVTITHYSIFDFDSELVYDIGVLLKVIHQFRKIKGHI